MWETLSPLMITRHPSTPLSRESRENSKNGKLLTIAAYGLGILSELPGHEPQAKPDGKGRGVLIPRQAHPGQTK